MGHPLISSVNLVGSVRAGRAVSAAIARRSGDFIPYALELGGCDAAYVRFDCNLERAAASLADGAFFNSGQSCCGIQRIFVHSDVYSDFVRLFTEATCVSTLPSRTLLHRAAPDRCSLPFAHAHTREALSSATLSLAIL